MDTDRGRLQTVLADINADDDSRSAAVGAGSLVMNRLMSGAAQGSVVLSTETDGAAKPASQKETTYIVTYFRGIQGISAISRSTLVACIGAFLGAVMLAAVVIGLSDEALQGTGTDKECRERACLLDNAKFACLVLVVFSSEEIIKKQPALAGAVDMIDMPMLSFISGMSAKGLLIRRQDIRMYLAFLVFPTLLWVFIVNPLIVVPLMSPPTTGHQFWAFITLQTFNLPKVDLATTMPYIWYLFPALILWRGASMLLTSSCPSSAVLALAMATSCGLGYRNLDDNVLKLSLNPVVGYLPYFAIGLVFPLEAACRSMYVRAEPACTALAACAVLLWVSVIIPSFFASTVLPDAAGWYGSDTGQGGGEIDGFRQSESWDYYLYWTRRCCKVAVDMAAVMILIFLVLPRSKTWGTRAGRFTLYPYLFQQLASNYLGKFVQLMGVQDMVNHEPALLAVTWLHLPWAVCVCFFFSTSLWRSLFSWALEPVWFEKLLLRLPGMRDEGQSRVPALRQAERPEAAARL